LVGHDFGRKEALMLVQLFQQRDQGGRVRRGPGDDVGLVNETVAGQEGGIVLQFGFAFAVVAVSSLEVIGAGDAAGALLAVRSFDDAAFVWLFGVGGDGDFIGDDFGDRG
jgi:hypothetical protein